MPNTKEVEVIISTLKHQLDDLINTSFKKDIERNSSDIKDLQDKYDRVKDETTKNTTNIEAILSKMDEIQKGIVSIEERKWKENLQIILLLGGVVLGLINFGG